MSEQSRPLVVAALGGVYEADAFHPPVPPPGAQALEITDPTGRLIAFSWVAPEYADETLWRTAWNWLRSVTPASSLRLLP